MQGYSAKYFLEQMNRKMPFPVRAHFALLISFFVLIIGAGSMYSVNQIQTMINKEFKARSDFNSTIDRNLEVLSNSVRLGIFTGHISWETRYFESVETILNFKNQELYSSPAEAEAQFANIDRFFNFIQLLRSYDDQIFAAVRTEKKDVAFDLVKSLDRERLLGNVEKAYVNIRAGFTEDEEEDAELLAAALDKMYIILAVVLLVFLFGLSFGIREIWLWMKANRSVTKELIQTVQSQTADLEEERALNLRNHQMVELGTIAGGIGHEILNPLAIALMSLKVLEGDLGSVPNLSEKLTKNIGRLKSNLERVGKIVKGLKNYSRQGDSDPFQSVSLAEIWSNIAEISCARFKKMSIEFKSSGFNENLALDCSPVQIEQIIVNLLTNASDAVENTENAWVEVSVEPLGPHYLFKVTDSGLGIPQEVVLRMFDSLFTTKPVGKGTGLGMTLI